MQDFNAAPRITKAFDPFQRKVKSKADYFNALQNEREYDQDALRGGNTSKFKDETALRLHYDDEAAKLRAGRYDTLKEIENAIEGAIAETLTLDTETMLKFSEVVKLSGLSASDVRRMARDNRENYSVLVALSSADNAFSKELKTRLDAYRDHLSDTKQALYRFSDRATFGEAQAIKNENYSWWVSSRLKRTEDEYNKLQEFLQGDGSQAHPMQDAFNKAAEAYAARH